MHLFSIRKHPLAGLGQNIDRIPLESPIGNGPLDDEIVIKGMPKIQMDDNGDFLAIANRLDDELDAISTFAIVRHVLNHLKRILRTVTDNSCFGDDLPHWRWGDSPLGVFPHWAKGVGASYSFDIQSKPSWGRLVFFYTKDPTGSGNIYSCRHIDSVAHETGHAFLDLIRPDLYPTETRHAQSRALIESFADLSVIFCRLSRLAWCERLTKLRTTELRTDIRLRLIHDKYLRSLGKDPRFIVDCCNKLSLEEAQRKGHGHHLMSQLLTSAIYEIAMDIYDSESEGHVGKRCILLHHTGNHVAELTIRSMLQVVDGKDIFSDVANCMIESEDRRPWREIIRRRFSERGIIK